MSARRICSGVRQLPASPPSACLQFVIHSYLLSVVIFVDLHCVKLTLVSNGHLAGSLLSDDFIANKTNQLFGLLLIMHRTNGLCLTPNPYPSPFVRPRLRFDPTVDHCARYKCFYCVVLYCRCNSPAALLLSSVVQVEEVCDHSRVVPHYKLRWMALTVEQMFYGVWCHSTLRTNI